jgi:predicted aspartyl protease
MDIIDYPFIKIGPAPSRPMLFVRFMSEKGFQDVPALIDTGAVSCCLPAGYAKTLGLDLISGTKKIVRTGGGKVEAHVCDCGMQVWDTRPYRKGDKVVVHTVTATPVCFLPKLQEALLGVSFFNGHILAIDYKNKQFSISRPPAD